VTIVLLNVAWIWAMPVRTSRRSRFFPPSSWCRFRFFGHALRPPSSACRRGGRGAEGAAAFSS